jgi:hypothetical protein
MYSSFNLGLAMSLAGVISLCSYHTPFILVEAGDAPVRESLARYWQFGV